MKVKYQGNYKLHPAKHKVIAQLYASGKYTTEYLAKTYMISTRQVQRIANKQGVIRTNAESNKLIAPLKHYYTIPIELRVKRKQLSNRLRFDLINAQPYCTKCGLTVKDGIRLEVDHINEDAEDNDLDNLQVLCNKCNNGKSQLHRFPA